MAKKIYFYGQDFGGAGEGDIVEADRLLGTEENMDRGLFVLIIFNYGNSHFSFRQVLDMRTKNPQTDEEKFSGLLEEIDEAEDSEIKVNLMVLMDRYFLKDFQIDTLLEFMGNAKTSADGDFYKKMIDFIQTPGA